MILFDYLVITQKGTIRNLQEPVKFQDSNIMLIDDATRKNLELTKTMDGSREGSFLNNIDFTKTGGGGRKLHNWLSAPLLNTQAIGQRLDSVAFFFQPWPSGITVARRSGLFFSNNFGNSLT